MNIQYQASEYPANTQSQDPQYRWTNLKVFRSGFDGAEERSIEKFLKICSFFRSFDFFVERRYRFYRDYLLSNRSLIFKSHQI